MTYLGTLDAYWPTPGGSAWAGGRRPPSRDGFPLAFPPLPLTTSVEGRCHLTFWLDPGNGFGLGWGFSGRPRRCLRLCRMRSRSEPCNVM